MHVRVSPAHALLILLAARGRDGDEPLGPAAPGAVSLRLSPPAITITAIGDTARLSAEVRDENGGLLSCAVVGWASLDAGVATVSSAGLVEARAPGTALVRASFGAAADTVLVTVGQIAVMNADGTNPIRLTTSIACDGNPAWSPDGTKIAFVTTRDGNAEIYVMNADGTGQINLTNSAGNDDQPAWSPDGTRIAFRSERDGNGEVYIMNADGTNPLRLTNDPGDDGVSAWRPAP